jgi:hypothetical protein
LDDVSSV